MFNSVPQCPPNPIFGVAQQCKQDASPNKIDVTIGAYRDDEGKNVVLQCVRRAEDIIQQHQLDHEYLPLAGHSDFLRLTQLLMFGDASPILSEGRVASVQSCGGTEALRLAADFISVHFPGKVVYIPDTTWQNHPHILRAARVPSRTYPYVDGCRLAFDRMLSAISSAEEGSVVLLHACAHNPTGIDPSPEQWQQILDACRSRQLLPLFDNAYQGFVSGCPDSDAFAVRLFASAGIDMLIACSFSKNFGLYGERVGVLHAVCSSADASAAVASQLVATQRTLVSNCPSQGARIVAIILSSVELKELWLSEVSAMAARIRTMRSALSQQLKELRVIGDWSHFETQKGMFCFSGLNEAHVMKLRSEFHIYMTNDGRVSISGVNTKNVKYFAQSIAAVVGTEH